MPIYEYQCQKCGEKTEFLQKMSDPAEKTCPNCGKDDLQRLVSAAGFQLKGTGWYVTDFRDKGKKPDATSTGSSAMSDSKKTTATNDKPSKTADNKPKDTKS